MGRLRSRRFVSTWSARRTLRLVGRARPTGFGIGGRWSPYGIASQDWGTRARGICLRSTIEYPSSRKLKHAARDGGRWSPYGIWEMVGRAHPTGNGGRWSPYGIASQDWGTRARGISLRSTIEYTSSRKLKHAARDGGRCPPYGKWWAVVALREMVGGAHPTIGGRCPPYGCDSVRGCS